MPTSTARVPTVNGRRYVTQLGKHWSHKFAVEEQADGATLIPFGPGRLCRLAADDEGIDIRIDTPDPADLPRLREVVISHLARFAFRETLGPVAWTGADPA